MSKGRQIRICAALCALAALLTGARAEETRQDFPDNPRFTVQRFQDQEGMGAITATALGQDAQGFLWIGTQTDSIVTMVRARKKCPRWRASSGTTLWTF